MLKKILFSLLFAVAPFVIAPACHAQTGGGPGGPGGGGVTASTFYIASSCSGLSNCLAWVDDDATDNCGAATTAFMAQINAYSGPGNPFVFIQGSGTGKAYKLSSCNLAFTGPSGTSGVVGSAITINSQATIDCAQTGGNCIQMGKTNCSTSGYYAVGCHDVTWRGGTFVGCVNLATACIEVESGMFINIIDDVNFVNTGAGNATIGSCTNYSVQWDTYIGGQEFSRNRYYGTVKGQCFSINNDTIGGQNTLIFTNNVISHAGGANTCGSQAHFDSSAHTTVNNNTIYGWSSNITLADNHTTGGPDGGWMIHGNDFDYSAGCNGTVNAAIQFAGTTNPVGPAEITGNNNQSSPFIQQANGATMYMTGWTIFDNNTYITPNILIGGTTTNQLGCVPIGSGPTNTCYMGANPGFSASTLAGVVYPGWVVLQGNAAHYYNTALAANLSAIAMNGITLPVGTNLVACQVILTRAATTSSTLPSCTVSWTDGLTGVTESATLTSTSAANTVGTQASGTVYALINAASNITISTSGYVSTGATTMQYAVFADITRVY